jgi:hypothetical protein
MADRAHVTSVDALESFRSTLIVYLTKARPTLDEVSSDVQRMRGWLEGEQRMHWENELRRRGRALQEAQQALFSSKLSKLSDASAMEQMAVQRTKRALEEAEAKLRTIKQWNRVFDNRVGPLVKQMEKLQTVLSNDMVQAVAFLKQAIDTLHNYAGVLPPPATSAMPAESGTLAQSQSSIANSQTGGAPAKSKNAEPEKKP